MKSFFLGLSFLFSIQSLYGQESQYIGRPVSTYSIVAYDSTTGQFGVAVQSHWFSVGSLVTWVESGVGAVATQSFVDPRYGKLGIEMMKSGYSAQEALTALLAADEGRDFRQVAMVDKNGIVASHTGAKNIKAAGHVQGVHYSVQANLMEKETVWGAMSRAFELAEGDLADRMYAALEAAQNEGGDIRGKQSAALIVVNNEQSGNSWQDRIYDLRIEDHPDPITELGRLIKLQKAYQFMNEGDVAVEHNDNDGALKAYSAAEEMFPDNLEMKYWHAVALVNMGKNDDALELFSEIFKKDENWRELTPRLVEAGLFPNDEKLLKKIEKLK